MRKHRHRVPVKEVQNAMVDALETDSQFVNAITEIVGLGAAELVPKALQPLDAHQGLRPGFVIETVRTGTVPSSSW